MWTWCTKDEWADDYFDLEYCIVERGAYPSPAEARENAEKHGECDYMVLNVG